MIVIVIPKEAGCLYVYITQIHHQSRSNSSHSVSLSGLKFRNKALLRDGFYMSHRNHKDILNLLNSLAKIPEEGPKHIIISGDFNCPDINWESVTVNNQSPDKEI